MTSALRSAGGLPAYWPQRWATSRTRMPSNRPMLTALEVAGPALGEGLRALARVLGRKADVAERLLQAEVLLEGQLQAADEQLLGGADSQRRVGGNLVGQAQGFVQHLFARDDAVD